MQARLAAKPKDIRDYYAALDAKSSLPFDTGRDRYEYHWYEHPGIGRVEVRRKKIG